MALKLYSNRFQKTFDLLLEKEYAWDPWMLSVWLIYKDITFLPEIPNDYHKLKFSIKINSCINKYCFN